MLGRQFGLCLVLCVVTAGTMASGLAQPNEFPFDGELILDARAMPGSKRIPNMDVAADGKIALEMWCNRVDGLVVVAGDTITVMTGSPTDRSCPPERARGGCGAYRGVERGDQLAARGRLRAADRSEDAPVSSADELSSRAPAPANGWRKCQ